jgi:small conductance mechanosensitive channel
MLQTSTWEALVEQTRVTLLALFGQAVARLPAVMLALILLVLTGYCARVAATWADNVGNRVLRSPSLRLLFSKCAVIGIWLFGLLVAGLLVFPGLRLGDLVATLGLGSVAIGFAFQDIFKNFLAGILLLINEPFRIGDAVLIDSFEGVVEHIDVRTTNVRTYTGERVLIPNSIVFTSSVRVRTAFPHRRSDVNVGVAYDTDLELAMRTILAALSTVPGVLAEPAPLVDVTEFGDSAMLLAMRWWTASEQRQKLRVQTHAVIAVKRALDDAGIEIPFPIRTVRFAGTA